MAEIREVQVPDIGDFSDVPIIDVLVHAGDRVRAEDPLITLESDKATMDVPSPYEGTIETIEVEVGDTVSQGSPILTLQVGDGGAQDVAATAPTPSAEDVEPPQGTGAAPPAAAALLQVRVPDIGDFSDVPIIDVLVSAGEQVQAETPLITLESDKATMDVPAPAAGTVQDIHVAVGDTVSEGSLILTLEAEHAGAAPAPSASPAAATAAAATALPEPTQHPDVTGPDTRGPVCRPSPTADMRSQAPRRISHATPAVRRFARELGVDVSKVRGTGRKGRVLKEDVKSFVKQALAAPPAAPTGAPGALGIEPIPAVDFSKFGEIESQPLTRIQKISGPFLHRAWLNVPHVTHHDEADITQLEAFRTSLKADAAERGLRITALAFIMKAVAKALAEFPTFNASLSADGESLVLKKYFHIGIAVDTPNGLVVPVFRDVDKKGIFELAQEMAEVSARARDGKLKPDEMQGGCMSISSLGGIGGTGFTPIVNAPEVAILGVTRARMQPLWNGEIFEPRLMLPLDLSYDHRVIDGAEAARFVAHLCALLGDVRRLLL